MPGIFGLIFISHSACKRLISFVSGCVLLIYIDLEVKERVIEDMRLALTEQEETQDQMEQALEEKLNVIQELSSGKRLKNQRKGNTVIVLSKINKGVWPGDDLVQPVLNNPGLPVKYTVCKQTFAV